jgi:hypothetical protein
VALQAAIVPTTAHHTSSFAHHHHHTDQWTPLTQTVPAFSLASETPQWQTSPPRGMGFSHPVSESSSRNCLLTAGMVTKSASTAGYVFVRVLCVVAVVVVVVVVVVAAAVAVAACGPRTVPFHHVLLHTLSRFTPRARLRSTLHTRHIHHTCRTRRTRLTRLLSSGRCEKASMARFRSA